MSLGGSHLVEVVDVRLVVEVVVKLHRRGVDVRLECVLRSLCEGAQRLLPALGQARCAGVSSRMRREAGARRTCRPRRQPA